MRKTTAAIVVSVWLLAGLVAGCSGTTGNPSSEVGNPNPNGDVVAEPLRNVRLPGGYELRIREEWRAREAGGAVEVRDASDALLFTAGVTDDPAAKAELLRCSAEHLSAAWDAFGTIFCRHADRLLAGKKSPALFEGGVPIVVIDLIGDVDTGEFHVASADGQGSAAGASATSAAGSAGSPHAAPGICQFLPPGSSGCPSQQKGGSGAFQAIGFSPSQQDDKGVEGDLLQDASITLTIPSLGGAGDAGDSLCLFFLKDDPAGQTVGELRDAGLVEGRTCFGGNELQEGAATPAKGVAEVDPSALLGEIHYVLARVHNEGGMPVTITLTEVHAVSGATALTFVEPAFPRIVIGENAFTMDIGE